MCEIRQKQSICNANKKKVRLLRNATIKDNAMRRLNECLSAFSALVSDWDKIRRRCCPSNNMTGSEFREIRHTDGLDLLWVYKNIHLLMYQNQYDILCIKKYCVNSTYELEGVHDFKTCYYEKGHFPVVRIRRALNKII